MPLSLNLPDKWALKCLGLGGLLSITLWLPQTADALEAGIVQRTPFCQEAVKACRPLFYLNPADQVRVLQQSVDGKWLYVRYGSGSTGWIAAEAASLKKPEHLRAGALQPLAQPALALLPDDENLYILQSDALRSHTQPAKATSVLGLEALLAHPRALQVGRCQSASQFVCAYGLQTQEGQTFLLRVQLSDPPHYRTLLRLSAPAAFKGLAAQPQGLVILAQGEGQWGESVLVGLGPDEMPYLLIRQAQEILTWVPQAVRSGLNLESLRLMHLNRDGVLLVSAFHLGLRRHVLLRLRADATAFWVYEGLMHWPDQSALSPREEGVQVRGIGAESDFYVVIATERQTLLAYYSGSQEPLAVQALAQPVQDAQMHQETLWILQSEGLRPYQPHFSP